MRIIKASICAVLASKLCLAQTWNQFDPLSCEAVIQTNVAVCLANNDVTGLRNVEQQIAELERRFSTSTKDHEQLLRTVSRLYLRLFRATREIALPANNYEDYIIKNQGYNLMKPMRHPEVARAIAFPSEEATLITNAVLRQAFDQYRAAKKQMEDNMGKKRMLDSIQAHILGYFKGIGHEMSKSQNTQMMAQLRLSVTELIPSAKERDAILELLSPEQEGGAAKK